MRWNWNWIRARRSTGWLNNAFLFFALDTLQTNHLDAGYTRPGGLWACTRLVILTIRAITVTAVTPL